MPILPEHASVGSKALQLIDTRPIWQIANGRYGMDRTRPLGEKWNVETCPWAKKILEKWKDPECQELLMRAGSQTFKTAIALMMLAWSTRYRPGPKLWLTAKDDLAKDVSGDRIQPTLDRCPDLEGYLMPSRVDKTTYKVRTVLCTIDIAGAESSTSLEQNPYGEIYADECRNYEKGRLAKIRMRQRSYRDAKRVLFSTPDLVGDEFDQRCGQGEQYEWLFPCVGCGQLIGLVWNKKFSRLPDEYRKRSMFMFEKDGNELWLECSCNHRHHDTPEVRRWILDSGDWVAMNDSVNPKERDPSVSSFHWPAHLNPRVIWYDTLKGFRTAMHLLSVGNTVDLKVWVTETLGEPWREGQHIEDLAVVKGSYTLASANTEWAFVFMTVDVGLKNFWAIVRGWNYGAHTQMLFGGELHYWQDVKDLAAKYGLVMESRNEQGLALGPSVRVFIDANWEDPNNQEVHRTAAEMGWTCLIGDPRAFWEIPYTENGEKRVERRLYSDPKFFDSKVGIGGDSGTKGIEIRVSDPTCQDALDELLAGRTGKFEYPEDVHEKYLQHMRNEPKLSRISPKDGHIEYYRERQGPQHLRDCEKYQVAAAAIAGCLDKIKVPVLATDSGEASDEGSRVS